MDDSVHIPRSPHLTVVHRTRGRMRIRVMGLRHCPALARRVRAGLAGVEGLRRIDTSAVTGTVLLEYRLGQDCEEIFRVLSRVLLDSPLGSLEDAPESHRTFSSSPAPPREGNSMQAGPDLTPEGVDWHSLTGPQVLDVVSSDGDRGLGELEARRRLSLLGPNRLPPTGARSSLSLALEQFTTAPVAMLAASAAVSLLTGGLADAAAILTVVLINAVIGYVTESQSERIIASLDAGPKPRVRVLRDGGTRELSTVDVVVGDLIIVSPGVRISGDARLLEAQSLSMDESSLTGESMPVSKDAECALSPDTPLGERRNMLFSGTVVTGGSGLAVVVTTGALTEMGLIQRLVGEARPPLTPMETQLSRMGRELAVLSGAVCAGVFVLGALRGYGLLEMLKASISLAVAAVPEGLPAVATTTLALGIQDMRRRRVLVRHLDAVESLGSVQVFCLDKTGTLTLNRMAAVSLHVGGVRLSPRDALGSRGEAGQGAAPSPELERLVQVVALCSESDVGHGVDGPVIRGTPTENALLELALTAGVDVEALRRTHPRLAVRHRSEKQQYMVTLHRTPDGGGLEAVKGSPSQLLAACDTCLSDGASQPLSARDRRELLAENDAMAGEALRVLGVAYRQWPRSAEAKGGWVWLGLVGMADPIRPGMQWLLAQFHRAGIRTVMITGDQSATAYAVGKELNLSEGRPLEILDSTSLERIDPALLAGVVPKVHVYSRVSPAHKLQIVQALQEAGQVVAMTGDGVNDGPALKAANVGVAMGGAGTEVARSVADVVLEDDNLRTMVVAVEQGRTIYENIRKALRFLISTNLTEIEVMFAGVALRLGQPMNPMQLLWINLISDIFPGLALALEPAEPGIIRRPPRDPEEPIIRRQDLRRLLGEATVISAGSMAAYGYGLWRYGQGPRASNLAFQAVTLGELLHAISCRAERHSIYSPERLQRNRKLELALGGSLLAQLLTIGVPGLRRLLGTTPLGLADLAVLSLCAVTPLLVNEATKAGAHRAPRGDGSSGAEDNGGEPPDET